MSSSRRQYPFHLIEPKWQQTWEQQQAFRAFNPNEEIPANHPFAVRHGLSGKVAATQLPPKFYILDMFPYPSGAGLHVGHPEGYTATDILARYRRACGFNVLHPMGWDSFGLPAEQYAVKTGQHPRVTTEANIANFTRQIKSLGFSYDWSRELATTDVEYFKWTQWIFLKLYNSYFDAEKNSARPISELIANRKSQIANESAESLRAFVDSKRLAYVSEAPVNWCPELGTVLANEEVIDGKSEVGGFPVIRKPMRQWMLRITAYAEKLLADLDTIDWTDSLKEMQRNWIGRSEGAEVRFKVARVQGSGTETSNLEPETFITVFTTRPDTLFGATYMVLSPEHKLVDQIVPNQWPEGIPDAWKGKTGSGNSIPASGNSTPASGNSIPVSENAVPVSGNSIPASGNSTPGSGSSIPESGKSFPASGNSIPERRNSFPEPGKSIPKAGTTHFETPKAAVEAYRVFAAGKSDLERTELAKDKSGVFTGAYAINPVNGEKIPIWIADYVLASYGTGAIMAVPAHDERDWEFAKKFSLPIEQVVIPIGLKPLEISPKNFIGGAIGPLEKPFCEEGIAISSPESGWRLKDLSGERCDINGLPTAEAKAKISAWLEEKGLGKKTINYKLRDWLFSRQRYWGEPFPIIWKKDAAGNLYHEALPESSLPLLPPTLEDYKPTAGGEPPLARAKDWLNLPDGSVRETNTMPQWAGSCWYYLRYTDAKNNSAFVGKDAQNYWMGANGCKLKVEGCKLDSSMTQPVTSNLQPATPGVDLYVGGTEHAVLHLLYARFWHKVLFDLGYVSTPEPFYKLVNQGLILGEDGQKMSKSRGNVVNPDDVLVEYGADAFRLYEMFMGPLQDTKPWNTKGVEGVYRFLGRVWRLFVDENSETEFEQAETLTTKAQSHQDLLNLIKLNAAIKDVAATPAQLKTLHACIKKVTEDLDGMRFNTAISAMMVFVNDAITWETKPLAVLREFLILLQPFAPHIAEELWHKLLSAFRFPLSALAYQPWPKFDAALLVESEIEIPVQVNGKFRDTIKVAVDADHATLEAAAKASEKVQTFIAGKTIKKVIIVPKRMVNLIVG